MSDDAPGEISPKEQVRGLMADLLKAHKRMERLAKHLAARDARVRAEERERCAKVADAVADDGVEWPQSAAYDTGYSDGAEKATTAIRAMGDTDAD